MKRIHSVIYLIVLLVVGCGDPYKQVLSESEKLTPASVKKIVDSLPAEDAAVFDRWAKRSISGERFAGEPGAHNVRAAISNQLEYEQKKKIEQEEVLAREREKQAEVERQNAQRLAAEQAAKQLLEQRQKVDAAIRQFFDVKLIGYTLENTLTPLGSVNGQQWRFSMKLTNRMSDADVVGMAGWMTIYDVFNKEFGSIPFKLEPSVRAGKAVTFDATLPYNSSNASHVEMMRTRNIRSTFFLESLALNSGHTIDANSLNSSPANDSVGKTKAGGI